MHIILNWEAYFSQFCVGRLSSRNKIIFVTTQTTKHNQQLAIVYLGLLLENWNFLNFLSSTRNQKIENYIWDFSSLFRAPLTVSLQAAITLNIQILYLTILLSRRCKHKNQKFHQNLCAIPMSSDPILLILSSLSRNQIYVESRATFVENLNEIGRDSETEWKARQKWRKARLKSLINHKNVEKFEKS